MFLNKICVATVLLSIHAASTYILLTANLDDVHALAKQIAASPVAEQLNTIIHRASNIFNQHSIKGKESSRQRPHNKKNALTNKASRQQPQMRSDPSLDYESDYPDKQTDIRYSDVDPPQRSNKDVPLLNDDDGVEVWKPNTKVIAQELNAKMSDTSSEYSDEDDDQQSNRVERRRQMGPDLIALGKNTSFYLKSIKKIFENV